MYQELVVNQETFFLGQLKYFRMFNLIPALLQVNNSHRQKEMKVMSGRAAMIYNFALLHLLGKHKTVLNSLLRNPLFTFTRLQDVRYERIITTLYFLLL